MERELKPCPFCGARGDKLFLESYEFEERQIFKWSAKVLCTMCLASAISHRFENTKEKAEQRALNAWNMRS